MRLANGLFIYVFPQHEKITITCAYFSRQCIGDMATCPECGASGCGNVIWDVVAAGWFFSTTWKKQLSCASAWDMATCPVWQCCPGSGCWVAAGRLFFILFSLQHSKITINLWVSFLVEPGRARDLGHGCWVLLQVVFIFPRTPGRECRVAAGRLFLFYFPHNI